MSQSAAQPILFVTTALGTGGAEQMLLKILQRMDRSRWSPTVVSLLGQGTVGDRLQALGIPVVCLQINSPWGMLAAPIRLARLMRHHRFRIIQGWMYHGNLLAWMGRLLANSSAPLSFSIRHSLYGLANEQPNTRWIIRLNGWLSTRVQGCIFNSQFSLVSHREFGFGGQNMVVIPNGFDLQAFASRSDRVLALRDELGVGQELVVGMVARFHPVKGHQDFLQAAAIVHQRQPRVRFLLAGTGVAATNSQLAGWVDSLGLTGVVQLLGERSDIADLNNVFDVACLSSRGEAFPNVVGESMACETPCVVTDVGDCAEIVGTTGRVVPREDPAALARALLDLLEMPRAQRQALGHAARIRVVEHFNMDKIAQRYQEYFEKLLVRQAVRA